MVTHSMTSKVNINLPGFFTFLPSQIPGELYKVISYIMSVFLQSKSFTLGHFLQTFLHFFLISYGLWPLTFPLLKDRFILSIMFTMYCKDLYSYVCVCACMLRVCNQHTLGHNCTSPSMHFSIHGYEESDRTPLHSQSS